MKFVLGLPEIGSSRIRDSQSLPISEDRLVAISISIGALLVALYIAGMGTWWTLHEMFGLFDQDEVVWRILLAFLAVTVVHEAMHLLAFPGFGIRLGVIGYYHQGGAPFAAFEGPVSRNRYIVVLLAPLIVLTSLLLIAGIQSPGWRNELFFCATVNVFGSGFDLFQPSHSFVRCLQIRGFKGRSSAV